MAPGFEGPFQTFCYYSSVQFSLWKVEVLFFLLADSKIIGCYGA